MATFCIPYDGTFVQHQTFSRAYTQSELLTITTSYFYAFSVTNLFSDCESFFQPFYPSDTSAWKSDNSSFPATDISTYDATHLCS